MVNSHQEWLLSPACIKMAQKISAIICIAMLSFENTKKNSSTDLSYGAILVINIREGNGILQVLFTQAI